MTRKSQQAVFSVAKYVAVTVMNTKEDDTLHETFNCQFDALFGEDCCDSSGHLHYIHQGKLRMGLVDSIRKTQSCLFLLIVLIAITKRVDYCGNS
jgi:hypothetical protein